MSLKVTNVDLLQKYFSGVVSRSNHHAHGVKDIIYSLLGIIILKKDVGSEIEVRGSHEDETENILWVTIGGVKYAFRYDHATGNIEVRINSYAGPIKFTINNSSTPSWILSQF